MDRLNVLLILLTLSINIALARVFSIQCLDDVSESITQCIYLQNGIYKLINVDNNVKTVTFDRLTDSRVVIPSNVEKLIFSSAFDTLKPCDHVIAQKRVLVRIEDQDLETECVSKMS